MKDFKRPNNFNNDRPRRDFGGNNKFGGNKSFGGDRPRFSGGRDEDRPMYPATCGECGKSCQVPFRPSGDKPVLCSDCFGNSRGESRGGDRNDRGGRDFTKPSYAPKNTFHSGNENRGNDDMKKQFDTLSNKLDTIITLLSKTLEAPKKSDRDLGTMIKEVIAPEKTPAKKEVAKKEVKTTAKKTAKVAAKKVVAKKTTKKK